MSLDIKCKHLSFHKLLVHQQELEVLVIMVQIRSRSGPGRRSAPVDEVRNDGINQSLEACGGIREAKGHDEVFRLAEGCVKGGPPLRMEASLRSTVEKMVSVQGLRAVLWSGAVVFDCFIVKFLLINAAQIIFLLTKKHQLHKDTQ